MISVIVPVYKVEKYLRKCVESIQMQTYTDLEIILVDDGSPDRCGAICDELAAEDKRIKVIHQKNGGLSAARNTGIDQSHGDYIAFIDSDDYIEPQMMELLLTAMEEADTDITMCGCKIVSEDGRNLGGDDFEDEILTGESLIIKCVLPLKTAVWNKLFRRGFISIHRFPSGKIHGEDLVFLSNTLSDNTLLKTISYCGYNYTKHLGSITTGAFSEKSFDEVYCKDIAAEELSKKFPAFKDHFMVWRFRARMNVLRSIVANNKAESYQEQIRQYAQFVQDNYSIVSAKLSYKEQIEYFLFNHLNLVYKWITWRK